jgi:hypothetical protein
MQDTHDRHAARGGTVEDQVVAVREGPQTRLQLRSGAADQGIVGKALAALQQLVDEADGPRRVVLQDVVADAAQVGPRPPQQGA